MIFACFLGFAGLLSLFFLGFFFLFSLQLFFLFDSFLIFLAVIALFYLFHSIVVFLLHQLSCRFVVLRHGCTLHLNHQLTQIGNIRQPIADTVDILRSTGNHRHRQALFLNHRMQRSAQIHHIAKRHISLYHRGQLLSQTGDMQQHISRGNLVVNSHQEMLLAADTADIALLITEAYILNGCFAVQMLTALFQVNGKAIPGIMIIHILFNIDINTADSINKTGKAFKINHDVIVDFNTQQFFYSFLCQLTAAVSVGMVNLIPAVTVNAYACITRYRKQGSAFVAAVEHYDKKRITAAHIVGAFINTHNNDILFQIQPVCRRKIIQARFRKEITEGNIAYYTDSCYNH